MKEFSLLGFAAHLAASVVEMDHETNKAVKHAAELLEKEAKAVIGEYQAQAGPFAAWADLAESTKEDRTSKGYPADEPLLRDGALRASIEHTAKGHEAVVGSNSDIAVYQEMGTSRIPARSFLGGTAFRKSHEIAHIMGHGAVKALVGGAALSRLPIP